MITFLGSPFSFTLKTLLFHLPPSNPPKYSGNAGAYTGQMRVSLAFIYKWGEI